MKQVFNPYLPAGEYIPDGEPHVFGNRVYVYGSHDRFNAAIFCVNDYVCYSAPVDDLSAWRYEGVIYKKKQDPLNKLGIRLLFAPDVVQGVDGRYYLYYAYDFLGRMGVAVSVKPQGPYEYYGHVRYADGREWGSRSGDEFPFDPGALVDDEGKLIGINTLITSYSGNYSGVGFAIPVNYAVNLAQQIIAGETPTHAQLGVSLSTVNDQAAASYGLAAESGAYVAAVTPDSGAAAAGIVPGDIVTAFDGQAVESASDLMLDVRTKNPGDTVTLTVNSGGQEKEVQVTLGDDSASQKAKQEQQSQEQSMNGYSLEDLFGRQR